MLPLAYLAWVVLAPSMPARSGPTASSASSNAAAELAEIRASLASVVEHLKGHKDSLRKGSTFQAAMQTRLNELEASLTNTSLYTRASAGVHALLLSSKTKELAECETDRGALKASVSAMSDLDDPALKKQVADLQRQLATSQQKEQRSAAQLASVAGGGAAAGAAQPVGGTGGATARPWLVIGIPTVPRAMDIDYINPCLATIMRWLPKSKSDPLHGRVKVMYVNNRPAGHMRYEEARSALMEETHPHHNDVSFVDNSAPLQDADPARKDPGDGNFPGWRVRQQTRDVVTNLREAAKLDPEFYLFLEDDMAFCPQGLMAIQYLIGKASAYYPDWLAIRSCYGMNGIFLQVRSAAMVTGVVELL